MKKIKYKQAFIILMKNPKMWKHLNDKDKYEIFKELNTIGFNYNLESYKFKGKEVLIKRIIKMKIEYNIMYNIGKCKYVVNYHKGEKHKDGSKFFDIATFKNKKKMELFIKELQGVKK